MSHRYNTRFQAKKAAMSQPTAPTISAPVSQPLSCKPASKPFYLVTSVEYLEKRDAELKVVTPLLNAATAEKDPFKKVFAVLRLFQYLEYHHFLLQTNVTLRKVVTDKCNEFITTADERMQALSHMQSNSNSSAVEKMYQEHYHLTMETQYLKESAERLLKVMKDL